MTPTDKDLAEFATLGLRVRLLETAQVQSWADSVIAAHDEPPVWAIDLSMAQVNEMGRLLNAVPGEISGDLPVKMLSGLVHRRWMNGSISIQQVRKIGFQLHLEDRLPRPDVGGDWGVVLECLFEEFDHGYRTEAEMRKFVEENLSPYAINQEYLPTWARETILPAVSANPRQTD
jgi:hypothetical protein